jgi:hypothetical protein
MPIPDPPSLSASPSDPARLWEAFCDALKEAGAVLRRPETPRDERTIAEAYRFLVRMVRAGFENTHELADSARPQLAPMVGPTLQYEGVTSDARYLHAFIDGRGRHRIRGTRGDAPLFEIGVYTGKMGLHEPSHLLASITEETLEVGGDGRIEIALGPEREPGNWLRTDAATRYLMIRQYAADWTGLAEGRFEIERLDAPGDDRPFDLESIRTALERTAGFVRDNPRIWAEISDYWAGFAKNRFVPQPRADPRTDIAPPSGHQFSCGWFVLSPGEALEIRFRPEGAVFWSLGLESYWYETIGYGRRDSHLNSGTARLEPDGSVRAVIAHERPAEGDRATNWLDPRGHVQGTMVFRWSRSTAPIPEIDCRLLSAAGPTDAASPTGSRGEPR